MADHQYDLVPWFYVYVIYEDKEKTRILHRGIGRALSGPDKATVRKHILQQHPFMDVPELHELKDERELTDAAAHLAKDPNWFPWTAKDVKASANAAIKDNGLLVPDPATVGNA